MPSELEGVASNRPIPGAIDLVVSLEGVDGKKGRTTRDASDVGNIDGRDSRGLAIEIDVADTERSSRIDTNVLLGRDRIGTREAGAELVKEVRLQDVGPIEGGALGRQDRILQTCDEGSEREAGSSLSRGGKAAIGLTLGGLEIVVVVRVAEKNVVFRARDMIEAPRVDVVSNLAVWDGGEVIEETVHAARCIGQRVDAEHIAANRIYRRAGHDVAWEGVTDGSIGSGDSAGGTGVVDGQVRSAGGDQLAEVAVAHGRGGHAIDGGDAASGAQTGIVEEKEALVAAIVDLGNEDGSADGHAELILAEDRFALIGGGEDVAGIEDVVAVELEEIAVEVVRARLGGDRHHARAAAELRGKDAGEGLKLAHGLDAGRHDDRVKGELVVVDTVHEPSIGVGAAAEGVEVRRSAGVEGGGAREVLAGLSGRDAGVQIDELSKVAAVERQFADGARADHLAEFGRFGADQRRGGRHFHRLGYIADRELEIGTGLLVHFERQILLQALLKAVLLDGDSINAGHEERDAKGTSIIGDRTTGRILVDFRDGDLGTRQSGTGGVGDRTQDGSGGDLGGEGAGQE